MLYKDKLYVANSGDGCQTQSYLNDKVTVTKSVK